MMMIMNSHWGRIIIIAKPLAHPQKSKHPVVVESHPSQKKKTNQTYINKEGFEFEQEWYKEHEDWLTIRINM